MVDPLVRNGLGISVKGKTAVREKGNRDVGLFVKEVTAEGAAARVILNNISLFFTRNLLP